MMTRRSTLASLMERWEVLKHLRELTLLVGAYFLYMFIRKYLIPNIELTAFENAARVVTIEGALGLLWELEWQSWAIKSAKAVVIILNWAYIVTFWPIIIATGVILYIFSHDRYIYYRNIILISFVLALILYAAFPLAPPRYLGDLGFIDTIQRFGPTWYGSREMQVYYNAFAAMPSLHFAWTVLFGVMFLRTKNPWIRPFGVIYPTVTFFAITITGNHYILDAIGGGAVIAASFGVYAYARRINDEQPPWLVQAKLRVSLAAEHLKNSTPSPQDDFQPFSSDSSRRESAYRESLKSCGDTPFPFPLTDQSESPQRRT
ncbi:MAG: phosphatase PAP2 family protein [Dehalococcoidia bacterium]|nr:phosphatase PAP2 family protein [Dehalococcoidia bacterium]